ncbi:myo-inositol-1-phosphate synthase [Halogeometricum pallidum JCM 14848]|uniref:Myo-inositol-1-phosphate synthase n=1 Tax=Halogeometricum pallidum JCM 14848 TaxID=1227487 RepID=M0DFA9_HALPD|nr:hypothetical protein [Halogeometricum pallidum]ELZ34181.1 myo-inositol-1-phosphate synthase [Halogeometricum pallidum JCM 14848]
MTRTRTGVWFVGARGNVAATATTGARGIARGTTDDTGTVTAREPYTRLGLPGVEGFAFGGRDIAERPLLHAATEHDLSRQFAVPEAYAEDRRGGAGDGGDVETDPEAER